MIDFLAFLVVFFLGVYAGYRMTCQYFNHYIEQTTAILNDVIADMERHVPRTKD